MCAGGGCEAAVTVRTRFDWLMFVKCGDFLYGKRFSLWLDGTVCMSYVRPAVLFGSEV